MPDSLTIALSKGRIFKETMPLLRHVGIEPLDDPESSRKLIIGTSQPHVRLLIIRASDVPSYVEYGAADLGVAGKDVLIEYDSENLYEPLDLNIARCRMVVAGPKDRASVGSRRRLRIATKYARTAKQYYTGRGQQVEVIKLYGSMELAPLVGLADCIVDLVDTGNTLKANGLVEMEPICDISSRLIVNKASMKTKHELIKPFIEQLSKVVS